MILVVFSETGDDNLILFDFLILPEFKVTFQKSDSQVEFSDFKKCFKVELALPKLLLRYFVF